MADIYSAVPGSIQLGAQDLSARTLPLESTIYPQCVSLIYLQAQKGSTKRVYANTAEAMARFGSETFEEKSKYYNHHTRLRNRIASAGGNCVYQRVIDPENTLKANVRVFLDVLKTKIPNYKRNSSGSYFIQGGNKVLDEEKPYIDGYLIKWFKSFDPIKNEEFGATKAKTGGLVRWKFEDEELHLISSETNIDSTDSGLTDYANKTVYTYDSLTEMYEPTPGVSVRKKYTVDGEGTRSGPEEQTLLTTEEATARSLIYPIFEAKASEVGEWYNQVGFSIESVTGSSVNGTIVKELLSYPYRLYIYNKATPKSSPTVFENLNGDTYTDFVFKKDATNPITQGNFSFEYATEFTFYNEVNSQQAIVYKDMEPIYFYRDNFDSILKNIMDLEKEYVSYEIKEFADGAEATTMMWYNFTTDNKVDLVEEYGLINPFTCKTSTGVNYYTVMYDYEKPSEDLVGYSEINLSSKTPIFLQGGSDGNLTVEKYEEFVRKDIAEYADENSSYMDQAVNPETFLWDNGFSLDTKKELSKFLAVRKDTVYVSCTVFETEKNKITSISDQLTIGGTLVNIMRMYLESETFGTQTIRGSVIAGTGRELSKSDRVSLIEDLAVKTVKLMGGTGEKWDATELFDTQPKNEVTELIDIEPKEIKKNLQTNLYESRVNYALPNQKKGFFYPALTSVYTKDTSVANSFINMLALPFCDRVAYYTWMAHTGDIKRTEEQFKTSVTNYANNLLSNAFANILTAVAECIITEDDKIRGYSWQLKVSLYGNVMKTKQIAYTSIYRNEN